MLQIEAGDVFLFLFMVGLIGTLIYGGYRRVRRSEPEPLSFSIVEMEGVEGQPNTWHFVLENEGPATAYNTKIIAREFTRDRYPLGDTNLGTLTRWQPGETTEVAVEVRDPQAKWLVFTLKGYEFERRLRIRRDEMGGLHLLEN